MLKHAAVAIGIKITSEGGGEQLSILEGGGEQLSILPKQQKQNCKYRHSFGLRDCKDVTKVSHMINLINCFSYPKAAQKLERGEAFIVCNCGRK